MRGNIDSDSLLKLILVLVLVWLVLNVLEEFVAVVRELISPFDNLLGLVVIVIIVLYLLDRL